MASLLRSKFLQWGGRPPVRFILTGFPAVTPAVGRPSYAIRPDRTPDASAGALRRAAWAYTGAG